MTHKFSTLLSFLTAVLKANTGIQRTDKCHQSFLIPFYVVLTLFSQGTGSKRTKEELPLNHSILEAEAE